jgi:hypothetical protein
MRAARPACDLFKNKFEIVLLIIAGNYGLYIHFGIAI